MSTTMQVSTKDLVFISLIYIIFFVFNPLLTLLCLFIAISNIHTKLYGDKSINLINLCCVLCAVFMGCINAVKVPENDLLWFLDTYKKASTTGYIDYIYGVGLNMYESALKDPVYTTFVWVMNRLLGGNVTLFKFFITLLNYLLLNKSIVKFCRHFNFSINETIAGVFLMCFIPYIFTMSLQLVRQFLAGSLFVYLLVDICFYKRINWILIFCMGLIHSSALFFIPFLLLPFMDKPVSQNKIYYVFTIIGIVGLQIISLYLVNTGLFNSDNPMSYAVERASRDAMFGYVLPTWKVIVVCIIGIFHFYLAYIKIKKDNPNTGLRRYCNTLIFLSIFILLNLHQSEISFRFLSYFFPFLPFMIVWWLNKLKKIIINTFLVIGMIVFWVLYLDIGTWDYKLPYNIWITPIFSYLFPIFPY
jgi:hypothetical protein